MVTLFRAYYKSIQNSQTSHDCIFHILRYFSTKLHNFTKLMMLFPAVLMNFPNSKVCLIGEWSIPSVPQLLVITAMLICTICITGLETTTPSTSLTVTPERGNCLFESGSENVTPSRQMLRLARQEGINFYDALLSTEFYKFAKT